MRFLPVYAYPSMLRKKSKRSDAAPSFLYTANILLICLADNPISSPASSDVSRPSSTLFKAIVSYIVFMVTFSLNS